MEKKFDVIVVGGGPAGIGASISAARSGVRTLLIERYGFLGGTTTISLVNAIYGIQLTGLGGIVEKIRTKLKEQGAVREFSLHDKELPYAFFEDQGGVDVEEYKFLVLDLIEEAEVELLLHSFVIGVLKADGVIVHNKSGCQEYFSSMVVDGTGDGDVAA